MEFSPPIKEAKASYFQVQQAFPSSLDSYYKRQATLCLK